MLVFTQSHRREQDATQGQFLSQVQLNFLLPIKTKEPSLLFIYMEGVKDISAKKPRPRFELHFLILFPMIIIVTPSAPSHECDDVWKIESIKKSIWKRQRNLKRVKIKSNYQILPCFSFQLKKSQFSRESESYFLWNFQRLSKFFFL